MKRARLILTCHACPEQYDVFVDDRRVGYLRLRNGEFRADYPDCGGETVYEAAPQGDGIFEADERGTYIGLAVEALAERAKKDGIAFDPYLFEIVGEPW